MFRLTFFTDKVDFPYYRKLVETEAFLVCLGFFTGSLVLQPCTVVITKFSLLAIRN